MLTGEQTLEYKEVSFDRDKLKWEKEAILDPRTTNT